MEARGRPAAAIPACARNTNRMTGTFRPLQPPAYPIPAIQGTNSDLMDIAAAASSSRPLARTWYLEFRGS